MPSNLLRYVAEAFEPNPPAQIGVAVSGGGDSMALLQLMHSHWSQNGVILRAVTVDHQLRPEAADEAKAVHQFCLKLGIAHDTLIWRGWDGSGNLQNEARKARYTMMSNWAREHSISTVALGHTADDQAETILMRIARRPGVDGLSGIAPRMMREGVSYVRPLLHAGRSELRAFLRAQDVAWSEDPSNEDIKYDRIKARKILVELEPLGIDVEGLAEMANHMAQARTALNWQTFLAARDCVRIDAGAVDLNIRALYLLPDEIQRRLLVGALKWISGSSYPPRRAAVTEVLKNLGAGKTLEGCQIQRQGDHITVFRELIAVRDIQTLPSAIWDDRWQLSMLVPKPVDAAFQVRVLGQSGLSQCPDWRATGRLGAVLKSTPGIWQGETLIAAPLADYPQNWHADIVGGEDSFFASLVAQ